MNIHTRSHSLSSHALVAALVATSAFTITGCGHKKETKTLPSQTVTRATPEIEAPPPAPPLPPPIREVQPSKPRLTKVIDPGEDDGKPKTLIEASRLAKERNRDAAPPIAEINDDNLHEYAEGGDVILMESAPAAPPLGETSATSSTTDSASSDKSADSQSPPSSRDEDYWRSKALALRLGWRNSLDTIGELELEAAALRQRFYAEDDPYVRDTQIKPAWDRTLDRIAELRAATITYERDLEAFLDEGRQAGALPGWLREGWELIPEAEVEGEGGGTDEPQIHEAVDIQTLEEDNGGRP